MDKNLIIKQQAAIIEALQNQLNNANIQLNDKDIELKKTQAMVESQKFEIDYLKCEVAQLQNKRFGKSSDKITKDNYNLFNMDVINEVEANQDDTIKENLELEAEEIEVKFKARKGKNLINKAHNIETVEIIHDIEESEKICSKCGSPLVKIGENVTSKIKFIPSKLIIEKHIYPTYKCVECSELENKALIINARNVLAFPKCMADASLVTHIIVEKFMKYVPLYRQEKFFAIKGIALSRKNMSNWLMSATNYLKPLFELMHKDILQNDIVLMDETTINVINNERSQCYIWMINSSKHDVPILLYFFKESREHKNALEILDGFKGKYVQSDCYGAYDGIPGVIDCCCWAHAKRKFTDILKIVDNSKYDIMNSTASTAVEYIRRLYKVEKDLEKSKAGTDEIYKVRQEKSIPILAEYKNWLETQIEIFPKRSKMAEALNYSFNNFTNLSNYCLDGRIDIDNNRSERQAKSYVMMRKNSLFCFSDVGAEASAILLSFVETAKFNDLNVEKYLEYVFNQLASYTESDYSDSLKLRKLLPYSKELPNTLKIQK